MNVLDLDKTVPDKEEECCKIDLFTPRPRGIIPRNVHDYQRGYEILGAMRRYSEQGIQIPVEWVDELQDIYTRR